MRLDSNRLELFSAKEVNLDDTIEIKDKEYKQDKQVVYVGLLFEKFMREN